MSKNKVTKVYLASPWFNEQQEAHRLTVLGVLSNFGNSFDVFSPKDTGICPADAEHGLQDAILNGNMSALNECDIVVANAYGNDLGTFWEVGYALALGKRVFIYDTKQKIGIEHPLCYTAFNVKDLTAALSDYHTVGIIGVPSFYNDLRDQPPHFKLLLNAGFKLVPLNSLEQTAHSVETGEIDFAIINTGGKHQMNIAISGYLFYNHVPTLYYCEGLTGNFNLMLAATACAVATSVEELIIHSRALAADINYKCAYTGTIE